MAGVGEPTLGRAGLRDHKARLPELVRHLLCPGVDNAGAEEQTAGSHHGPHHRGQADDDIRHDIGQDMIRIRDQRAAK